MRKKMNFSQKFIIVFLLIAVLACGAVAFYSYDYFKVEEVNNRKAGQFYDVMGVKAKDMKNMFAEGFDPLLPDTSSLHCIIELMHLNDCFITMNNPEKDVNATDTFESYTMSIVTQAPFVSPEAFGLTREDVSGFNNPTFWLTDNYFALSGQERVDAMYQSSEFGKMENDAVLLFWLAEVGDASKYCAIENLSQIKHLSPDYDVSYVTYSAYSKKIGRDKEGQRYPVSGTLFNDEASKVTQLRSVKVDGVTVNISICEYLSNSEKVKRYVKSGRENGYFYDSLVVTPESIAIIKELCAGKEDVLYTMISAKFQIDGIKYEIDLPFVPRLYDPSVGYGDKENADYAKLSLAATKSMTYLVTEFLNANR